MIKKLFRKKAAAKLCCLVIGGACCATYAQTGIGKPALSKPTDGSSRPASRAAAAAGTPAEPLVSPGEERPSGGTVITATQEASFDNSSRKAVFVGDVVVTDPQFKLTADQLTVFLKKESANEKESANDGTKPAPKGGPEVPGSGALERAVAEGHVVVTQIKRDEDGKITEHVGTGAKAVYDAVSGEFQLSGWPKVRQGINTHVATEESTVMTMTRDGKMKTKGGSRTVIQEKTPDER